MKPLPTRTLNPLPFGDLEPHRFEDLIRQLAYDLRRWKSLEATGRSGSDEGIDIRGTELFSLDEDLSDEDEDAEPVFVERLWIFQCKREKALSPRRLRKVVEDSLAPLKNHPPHGFVLAVACDVSKDARDAFREEMVARGVREFSLWAKGELEDMLFQSRNDRLLFAYFGIALQPRRRGLATTLRSEIAKKKQLTTLIGDRAERDGQLVLLRDPTDERYPREPRQSDPPARWILCAAVSLRKPGYLMVLLHEHLAALSDDLTKWDAFFERDVFQMRIESELQSAHAWNRPERNHDPSAHGFWNEYVEEGHRAYLLVHRAVPLERVLAIDPLGDGFYPVPHILVEFTDTSGPFLPANYRSLRGVTEFDRIGDVDLNDDNRVAIFPKTLPADNDPPPPEFDQTDRQAPPLSEQASGKLRGFLARVKPVGTLGIGDETTARAREEEIGKRRSEFELWRAGVARHVFSAFVLKLEAAGHRARVIVRTGAIESIEIRARLLRSHYNPSGHVRISFQDYGNGWWTPGGTEG